MLRSKLDFFWWIRLDLVVVRELLVEWDLLAG